MKRSLELAVGEFQTMIPSLEPNGPVAPGTHHHNEQTRGHAETHKHRSHHNTSQGSHQRVFRTDPDQNRLKARWEKLGHDPVPQPSKSEPPKSGSLSAMPTDEDSAVAGLTVEEVKFSPRWRGCAAKSSRRLLGVGFFASSAL